MTMNADTTLERFLDYSARLTANAAADPDVLGLVLVGSTAETFRVDEWSDHDFFWVVKNGVGERYRTDLSWIPNIESAVLQPRETDHGLKVVFDNGRVLEFAVFEDSELELAGLNAYDVAVDKTNIAERCVALAAKSADQPAFEWAKEFELFLSLILIGVGRARRGELLIAGQFIRSYVLNHLLGLIRAAHAPVPGTEGKEDNLNRFRRFEVQYPSLGRRIENAMQKDIDAAALDLVNIAAELRPMSDRETTQVASIKARLGWI